MIFHWSRVASYKNGKWVFDSSLFVLFCEDNVEVTFLYDDGRKSYFTEEYMEDLPWDF